MHAGELSSSRRTYGDAVGYDAYMGGWSVRLAPPFLRFALAWRPAALLDIGCGTGNLLVEARASYPLAALAGIDPSDALLARARRRPELADVLLVKSMAEALPFAREAFDSALSLLVLQELAQPRQSLAEIHRVVRRSGIVAACQWDFARMPVIASLVEALVEVSPASALHLRTSRVFTDEAELTLAWREAGFADVVATRIPVVRSFPDFDALWRPLLTGPTPSTLTLSALPAADRQAVRALMLRRLAPTEPFAIEAEAIAVRGVA